MCAIDEKAQIVRRAIKMAGGKEIHTVVAPAERAGKIGDRHHFQQRNPVLFQERQLFRGRSPGALGGKRPNVEFVEDLSGQMHPRPSLIAPGESAGIDHHGRSVRTIGLRARSRVGVELLLAVQAKLIERARFSRKGPGEIAFRFARERLSAAFGEDDFYFAGFGGPDPEADSPSAGDLGPNRITPPRVSLRQGLRRCANWHRFCDFSFHPCGQN